MDNDDTSMKIELSRRSKTYAKKHQKKSTNLHVENSKWQTYLAHNRKPSEMSIEKYSLVEECPLKFENIKRDEILLLFKFFAKTQKSEIHRQRLAINVLNKYKIKNTNIKQRLHTPDPNDDVLGVIDINEDYFSIVEGRPLPHCIPLFKKLNSFYDHRLRVRLEEGYLRDCILNIEYNYRREIKTYNNSYDRCKKQAKYFDNFISEDYRKSMELLQKCEDLKEKVNLKVVELENLALEKFTTKSRLLGLDYKYRLLQKYGRFLYYLSPASWRLKNRDFAHSVEIEAKGFDLGWSSDEDTFNVIFEKLKRECLENPIKPAIYYECPEDLIEEFITIEKQQLHSFTHVTTLKPHTDSLKLTIKSLKEALVQDTSLVRNIISRFESLLEFSDQQCTSLENRFHSIVNGFLYDSVASTDVLKLHVHLEFCYAKVFSEKPANVEIYTMTKALEKYYMDYMLKLESLHSNATKQAMYSSIKSEKNKMKTAEIATRELRLFNRLEKRLVKAYTPLYVPTRYVPMKNMFNIKKSVKKPVIRKLSDPLETPARELTEAEKEYLCLFTDWTVNDDPSKYLKSF